MKLPCPCLETLRDFSFGRLSTNQIDEIAEHLEECSACCDRLESATAEPDLLVRLLAITAKKPVEAESPLTESACHEVVSRLMQAEAEQRTLPQDAAGLSESQTPNAVRDDSLFGDFRLLRKIGNGHLGSVFEAHQLSLNRIVALKVFAHRCEATLQRRFERWAESVRRLYHANIAPVLSFGEIEGTLFYVMPMINGLNLNEILSQLRASCAGKKRGPFTPTIRRFLKRAKPFLNSTDSLAVGGELPSDSAVLPGGDCSYWHSLAIIGRQVAEALLYSHDQNVLHRGIRPSNVLLDAFGTVTVVDFGLSTTVEQQDQIQLRDMASTIRYSAPETFDEKWDVRSDLYSLGAMLYELSTLQPAFDEPIFHKLAAEICEANPRHVRAVNPDVPPQFEAIIQKAMARDPSARYATASEMVRDLQQFVNDEPIGLPKVGLRKFLTGWLRSLLAGRASSACEF